MAPIGEPHLPNLAVALTLLTSAREANATNHRPPFGVSPEQHAVCSLRSKLNNYLKARLQWTTGVASLQFPLP